jgi:hypothetical protein
MKMLSEQEQSLSLGRSNAYIATLKKTNRELYDYCTSNGKLFMQGYRKLIDDFDEAKCKVAPLFYHYKDEPNLRIQSLFTDDMAEEFGYKDALTMKQTISKRVWESEPLNRVKLLKVLKVFEYLIEQHTELLERLIKGME